MAVDKKISQLASGAPAQAGDEYVVARSGANYKLTLTNIAASMPPIGATTPNTGAFTTLSASSGATISGGNLTFSSTVQRITGDMSNATLSNRLAFQTSTAGGNTRFGVLPNSASAGTAGPILFSTNDPANSSTFDLRVTDAVHASLQSDKTGTASYLPMTFYTGGSERVRIDTSGRFGINLTPSTATDAKLQVTGGTTNATNLATAYSAATVAIVPKSTSGFSVAFASGTSDFPLLQVSANGAAAGDFLLQPYGGNVGIGTTSPVSTSGITQTIYGSAQANLYFQNSNSGTASTDGFSLALDGSLNAYVSNRENGPLLFATNALERMRIDSSGNVGIGTASPATKLTVSSATNAGLLVTDGTVNTIVYNSTGGVASIGTTSNHPVDFYSNNAARMRIDSSGNVGIGGTTATAFVKCQINGTLPTSSGISIGFSQDAAIPSGTTALYAGFNNAAGTQAASFTLASYAHYRASQGTFGAGSAVTNQYGYLAESTITGATNNFGFFGNIASGSNRWNFYAAGTAQNYFAGDTGVGTATISTTYGKLTVGGGITIANDQNAKFQIGRYSSGVANSYIKIGTNSNSLRISNAADTNDLFVFDNTGELIVGTTDNGAYNLQCNGTGVWGAGAYVNGSDARLKDNIATLNDGLNVVSQLRPVTFKYKPDYSKDQNVQTGFIAQELQAVLAGKDYVDGIVQAGPNHLNVAYQSLIPILVKAIQELTARVAELEAK
jgi:hypothetical protein